MREAGRRRHPARQPDRAAARRELVGARAAQAVHRAAALPRAPVLPVPGRRRRGHVAPAHVGRDRHRAHAAAARPHLRPGDPAPGDRHAGRHGQGLASAPTTSSRAAPTSGRCATTKGSWSTTRSRPTRTRPARTTRSTSAASAVLGGALAVRACAASRAAAAASALSRRAARRRARWRGCPARSRRSTDRTSPRSASRSRCCPAATSCSWPTKSARLSSSEQRRLRHILPRPFTPSACSRVTLRDRRAVRWPGRPDRRAGRRSSAGSDARRRRDQSLPPRRAPRSRTA